MKNKHLYSIIAFTILTISAWGQKEAPKLPIDSITGKITYTEVVKIDSMNKQELYSKAREWVAKKCNDSKDVIQMDDKENGKIIIKALFTVYIKSLGYNLDYGQIHYTFSIFLKDGRYKYEINDFYHTGNENTVRDYGVCEEMIHTKNKAFGISLQKVYNNILFQTDNQMKGLISDFKLAMADISKDAKTKKPEW